MDSSRLICNNYWERFAAEIFVVPLVRSVLLSKLWLPATIFANIGQYLSIFVNICKYLSIFVTIHYLFSQSAVRWANYGFPAKIFVNSCYNTIFVTTLVNMCGNIFFFGNIYYKICYNMCYNIFYNIWQYLLQYMLQNFYNICYNICCPTRPQSTEQIMVSLLQYGLSPILGKGTAICKLSTKF